MGASAPNPSDGLGVGGGDLPLPSPFDGLRNGEDFVDTMRMFMKKLKVKPESRMELGGEANFADEGFYSRYTKTCKKGNFQVLPSTAWRKLGAKANPNDGSLYSLYTACCQANKYQARSFEEFSRALLLTLQAFDIAASQVREKGVVYIQGMGKKRGSLFGNQKQLQ